MIKRTSILVTFLVLAISAAFSQTSNQIPSFSYKKDFGIMAAGGGITTALTATHHSLLAANTLNWTGYYFASWSGRHIANSCKIEDARFGEFGKFGTAPVYGMPSHYARNAIAATAGISLASWVLHRTHHNKAALWLPASSGIFQTGVAGGNVMGGCN